ncbi:MAG: SLBB domain-containing protein [Spirochaetota bacterium]
MLTVCAGAWTASVEKEMVTISIAGAVAAPGPYRVPKNTPWREVFAQCGGVTADGMLPRDFDLNAPVTADRTVRIARRTARAYDAYER